MMGDNLKGVDLSTGCMLFFKHDEGRKDPEHTAHSHP